MFDKIKQNWITTFFGVAVFTSGYVSLNPDDFGGVDSPAVKISSYIALLSAGGGLTLSKDAFNLKITDDKKDE